MLKANRNMKGQKQAALKKTTGENKILLRVIAFFIKNGNSLESCCFLEVSYNAKCKKYNIVISALLAGCAYSRENLSIYPSSAEFTTVVFAVIPRPCILK